MTPKNVLVETDDLSMSRTFAAMAAFPTLEETSSYLKREHGMQVSVAKLKVMRTRFPERYERARDEAVQLREKMLANDLLDNASYAVQVEGLAIKRTMEMLENDEVGDPSKVARDLADVTAKSLDKKLALEGRPSRVTENRSPDEIIRALEGLGVVEGTIEDAEVVEASLPKET